MKMRSMGRCGLTVSEIGLGCEHLEGKDAGVIREVIDAAMAGGINVLDAFMAEPNVRSNIGAALKGKREKMQIQGHFGAVWQDGQYSRVRDLALNKTFFEDLLTRLQTDYLDFGLIHFVDDQADFDKVFKTDLIDYIMEQKAKGVIRAVGMSSHDPVIAKQAVDTGLIDMLMFSVNPMYDLFPAGTDIGEYFNDKEYMQRSFFDFHPDRVALYKACEAAGVGITVMKTLGAGMLMYKDLSPFGVAFTENQLIHYALTRPAVASVLIGCKTPEQVEKALEYETATDEEKDYSVVLSQTKILSDHKQCMYCNHCHPCPSRIDVASVNRYLDLASVAGDTVPATVRDHYLSLAAHASDCVKCGMCETRCPFGVPVRERMDKAVKVFGK